MDTANMALRDALVDVACMCDRLGLGARVAHVHQRLAAADPLDERLLMVRHAVSEELGQVWRQLRDVLGEACGRQFADVLMASSVLAFDEIRRRTSGGPEASPFLSFGRDDLAVMWEEGECDGESDSSHDRPRAA